MGGDERHTVAWEDPARRGESTEIRPAISGAMLVSPISTCRRIVCREQLTAEQQLESSRRLSHTKDAMWRVLSSSPEHDECIVIYCPHFGIPYDIYAGVVISCRHLPGRQKMYPHT